MLQIHVNEIIQANALWEIAVNKLKMVPNPVQNWQADAAAGVAAPLRMFIPLSKINVEKRLVYGVATAEIADRAGETCDYATTKPYYEKWSGDISKASGGKSFGNVRAMHSPIAAGKVTALTFNDISKQIEICAEVVDDNEWKKVEKGVYTGFSQGGKYVKRWTVDGVVKYTADPAEVSLVDVPCLASATFEVVKAEGVIEKRHFDPSKQVAAPDNGAVMNKAAELAQAAGDADFGKFIEPARDALMKAALPLPDAPSTEPLAAPAVAPSSAPGDGLEQVWKAKDGSTYAKKAEAMARNATIDAAANLPQIAVDAAAALDAIGKALGAEGPTTAVTVPAVVPPVLTKVAEPATLAKSMYTVSSLADAIGSLTYIRRSCAANLDSDSAAKAETLLAAACDLLVTLAQETAEALMSAPANGDYGAFYMAAGVKQSALDGCLKYFEDHEDKALAKGIESDEAKRFTAVVVGLEKAGARNSKTDASKIQAMHDHACDLGATCDGGNCADDDASKALGGVGLAKALGEVTARADAAEAGRAALQELVEKRLMPHIESIGVQVAKIAKTPQRLPISEGARAVEKGAGDGTELTSEATAALELLKSTDQRAYASLMIKIQQQQPHQFSPAR